MYAYTASMPLLDVVFHFFFFNDTATTEIYTLSLHDALPISGMRVQFTAGGEKCLERIMIGRKTLARFLRGEDCLLLPVRRAAVVGVFFCLAGTRQIGRAHVCTPVTQ